MLQLFVPGLVCVAITDSFSDDVYSGLMQLTNMQRLVLSGCTSVPECLGQLTSLQALHLDNARRCLDDSDSANLAAALPHLTCLTQLALQSHCESELDEGLHAPPRELAGLTQLRRLAWIGGAADGATLPAGPWLAGLERLVAPSFLLGASLQQLFAAPQLSHLGVTFVCATHAEAVTSLLCWAVNRPSLLHLTLHSETGSIPASISSAAVPVQRCRPALLIAFVVTENTQEVCDAVCGKVLD